MDWKYQDGAGLHRNGRTEFPVFFQRDRWVGWFQNFAAKKHQQTRVAQKTQTFPKDWKERKHEKTCSYQIVATSEERQIQKQCASWAHAFCAWPLFQECVALYVLRRPVPHWKNDGRMYMFCLHVFIGHLFVTTWLLIVVQIRGAFHPRDFVNLSSCVSNSPKNITEVKGLLPLRKAQRLLYKALRRFVDISSCVGASDSGAALKSGFRKASMPAAHARHHLDEMSPVVSLNKRKMTPGQIATLKKAAQARRKSPASAIEKTCSNVIGGDNATESEVAGTKSQLRRTNALGRQSPATSHVDQLAARRLLKRPGLVTVMQSMATYRAARVNALGHSPANFLNLNNDSSWLYAWRYGKGEKNRMQTSENAPFVR